MPGINRIPYGLLGLLGLKSLGQNPSTLLSQVSPVVPLLPFWIGGQTPNINNGSAGISASGFIGATAHTVPNGKVWFVIGHSAHASAVVGATVTFKAAAGSRQGAGAVVLPQWAAQVSVTLPTTGGREAISALEGLSTDAPLIAGPGCQFGAFADVAALAGGEAFTFSTIFFEFDI